MIELNQQLWRGKHLTSKMNQSGANCQSMNGEQAILFIPVNVEPNSTYRIHLDLKCENGNGILFCNFYANKSLDFPQVKLICDDITFWSTFEIQVKTGNFSSNSPILLRLWRTPKGTGSLLVKRVSFEKLPYEATIEGPKLIASVKPIMENDMSKNKVNKLPDLLQQNMPKSELRGHNLGGPTRVINELTNPSSFPTTSPKLGRPIRQALRPRPRPVAPKLPQPTYPQEVQQQIQQAHQLQQQTISAPSQLKSATGLFCSQYPRSKTMVVVVSELSDHIAMRDAFLANGIPCEGVALNDVKQLPIFIASRGNWVHFHINRKTTLTSQVVDQIREIVPNVIITIWMEPGFPVYDNKLLDVLRSADIALLENDIEMATYRAAGCFNAEQWDPNVNSSSRVKELAIRIGIFEMTIPFLPKDRTSYTFNRVMCIMQTAPTELIAHHKDNGIEFITIPFTECRDVVAKIIRFNPDLLHIHLDKENDNLPWRDLLFDLRLRMPRMLITLWHPGSSNVDQRIVDLRFSVDHIFIGNAESLPQYHAMSLIGVDVWNFSTSPSDNPIIFYNTMLDFARKMDEKRIAFLKNSDNKMVDLSIFIGTYNRLNQLRKAIETAIKSAGSRTIEIIVNDAGSTDGTQEWLRKYADNDKRLVLILSGKRTSFTQSFNEALQIAKGKYICWLSDDIVSEGMALTDMCSIMDTTDPIDLGGFCVRNSWGREYLVRFGAGFYWPTVGCVYTETFRKMNGFNMDYPYYSQDTDLDMRIQRLGGRIVACDHCHLLHDCKNDELRRNNGNKHTNMMGDLKYSLANWRPGETSRFSYPTFLFVPVDGCAPIDIIKAIDGIRKYYSNSHIFVGGETVLNICGSYSFVHRISTSSQIMKSLFDVVIEIRSDRSILVKPPDRSEIPFVKQMLIRL